MNIRDRIKELRRVKASTLRPHPQNWRKHPQAQQDALRGVLAEIGYADALLARELADGTLELIDGHLRAETTPEMEVPVLVLDVDESEARKILATLDWLARLAEPDEAALSVLLSGIETQSEALRTVLNQMLATPDTPEALGEDGGNEPRLPAEVEVPEAFQVVIECRDEAEQQAVFERMTTEGFKCRLLTL